MPRLVLIVTALACLAPASVFAQASDQLWGVSFGFAPNWLVPSEFKPLFDADDIDFEGYEFHVGFVRGSMAEGDWGVSFVRKPISEGSTLDVDVVGADGTFYTTTDDTTFTGIEVHRFVAMGTVGQRVQFGANLGVGAGWLRGNVVKRVVGPGGPSQSEVDSTELFPPRDSNIPFPLAKVEFAVAGVIGPGFKVRYSGGLNLPGYHVFSLTFVYLFGAL